MHPVTPTEFTPWLSLTGGALIGLSAVMVMALFGRIAGIAGITGGVLDGATATALGATGRTAGRAGGHAGGRDWRPAFLAGLVAAPLAVALVTGALPAQTVPDSPAAMALAGLLVGLGTAIGSGCTSGHGVCGLARLSPRSAVAVAIFVGCAVATVFVLRHVAPGVG